MERNICAMMSKYRRGVVHMNMSMLKRVCMSDVNVMEKLRKNIRTLFWWWEFRLDSVHYFNQMQISSSKYCQIRRTHTPQSLFDENSKFELELKTKQTKWKKSRVKERSRRIRKNDSYKKKRWKLISVDTLTVTDEWQSTPHYSRASVVPYTYSHPHISFLFYF